MRRKDCASPSPFGRRWPEGPVEGRLKPSPAASRHPLPEGEGSRQNRFLSLGNLHHYALGLHGADSYNHFARSWSGASGEEPPRNNVRPSGRVRSLPFARCEPSLALYPSTRISVPGSRACFVKPRRNNTFGVPASTDHFSTVPSGCF